MVTVIKWVSIILICLITLMFGLRSYYSLVVNPKVVEEIQSNPDGERAGIVMLLELKDGKQIPVNYLQEDDKIFVGADGRWWREFRDGGLYVSMFIRGNTLRGHAEVVLDNPSYTKDVFSRLRPKAPEWLPEWLNGKLIVITTDQDTTPRLL